MSEPKSTEATPWGVLNGLIREVCVDFPDAHPHKVARLVAERTTAEYLSEFYVIALERLVSDRKGKPAQPGSPLSLGHQHARARRLIAKTILRDLFEEAKRIHEATGEGTHNHVEN